MKRSILVVTSIMLFSLSLKAQIVSVKNNKVEVRDEQGRFIASSTYYNLIDAVSGNGIVVLWFESGKVEVRDQNLKFINSSSYSHLSGVKTSGRNVVLQFESGKVEVRDENLKFISSRN